MGSDAPADGGEVIEKIMAIRRDEFEAGLRRLAGDGLRCSVAGRFLLPSGARGGVAIITFEKLQPAMLGGLMRLPRARITIGFEATDAGARVRFLALFDRTFQRGGG